MNSVIYNPLEEFDTKFKALHAQNTARFLEELVTRSGVDAAQNRETVRQYDEAREGVKKLRRTYNWLRFWRVLACITLVLLPLVFLKLTPKIRALRAEIADVDAKVAKLLADAWAQMQPLNSLFTDRDGLDLIHQTVPLLHFDQTFSMKREADMIVNYDFMPFYENEESTVDVLSGEYNENPFLFESRLVHTMGVETYHGYKTIHWTETYRDANGNTRTRHRSQVLHATVVKPKPFYSNRVRLNYCAQGAPDLSFTRDASGVEEKSEREVEKLVKKGEKKLKKMSDRALKDNRDFTSMSNTEFEVLFDALDRDHEVQFRAMFTPLAQQNLVALLRSKDVGFGDDFHFIKQKRTNVIVTRHSQGRELNLMPAGFVSYSFDTICENFTRKNEAFFKAVYFDFAPLLAVPMYQERPVHSLKPIPDYAQLYSQKESESLANAMDAVHVVHPATKTPAILKATYLGTRADADEACITAYSYDIEKRVDFIPVYGGDGRFHNVPVPWDEYLPLEAQNHFFVTDAAHATERGAIAVRDGLCIYRSIN